MGDVREGPEWQDDRQASRGRLKTGWGPSRNFRGSIWGCRGPKPGLGTEGGVRNVLAPRLDVEKNEARTSLGRSQ